MDKKFKFTKVALLSAASFISNAAFAEISYIDFIDPKPWYQEYVDLFVNQTIKAIYKKANKPTDVNVVYELNYASFMEDYKKKMAVDVDKCAAVKYNPAWIDGVKNDPIVDANGARVFTVGENSSYVLAQRDLSRRGIFGRLNDHWFNWYIPYGNNGNAHIIQNLNKEDPYTPYKFKRGWNYYQVAGNSGFPVINTVIATDKVLAINIKGNFDANFTHIDAKLKPGIKFEGLYLTNCDFYKVKIVDNTAPRITPFIHKESLDTDSEGYHMTLGLTAEDSESHSNFLKNSVKVTFASGRVIYSDNYAKLYIFNDYGDQVSSVELLSDDGGLVGKKVLTPADLDRVPVTIIESPRGPVTEVP